jgi:uncharacterized protein
MLTGLPDSLDPWRAARSGLLLTGAVALSAFARLKDVMANAAEDTALVHYQLHFERDIQGRFLINGSIQTQLPLPCQRCLGVVDFAIDVPISLALVKTEAAAENLPITLEPLLVYDDRVIPLLVIEDELLLALPAIARHEKGDCQPPITAAIHSLTPTAALAAADTQKKPNPFAILRTIKSE